ncbi:oxidoreductase [Beijerinckia sp. L45]|uniref:oxidoreductase n=1 Tax=Beijerinckia sp. L45 TaxID=1641855 RepID=UPI00131C8A8D|nr:oxidoreductase [Beijerinckia sp. L45]
MLARVRDPVRVGLIGYGFSGRTFHAPLIQSVPGLRLCLVGSSDAGKVRADLPGMAVAVDPMAIASSTDIDLVVIATPNDTHAPLAQAALMAGKHVVIDKPFALDLGEARSLIATAVRCDRLLSVFHNRRWDSDYLSVKDAIADGVVGTVKVFESRIDRFRPQVRDRWRERGGCGGGLLFDLGPHLIDQALQLFGLPDRIDADMATLRTGALTDDWFHVVFDYPALRAVLQASILTAGGTSRFVVHGDAGTIVKPKADIQEQQLLAGMKPAAAGWGEDPDPLIVYDGEGNRRAFAASNGDQRLFYVGIADTLLRGAPSPVPPTEAIEVMACLEAALESARSHASIVPTP